MKLMRATKWKASRHPSIPRGWKWPTLVAQKPPTIPPEPHISFLRADVLIQEVAEPCTLLCTLFSNVLPKRQALKIMQGLQVRVSFSIKIPTYLCENCYPFIMAVR